MTSTLTTAAPPASHPAPDVETIAVGVGPLLFEDVVAVAREGARVEITPEALAEIRRSRVVEGLADHLQPHCWVSTGFGALTTRNLGPTVRAQLQRSMVRNHASGSGPEVEREIARALMLLRLSTLATLPTGVSEEVAVAYAAVLNAGITPVVHEYGSFGCSDDLAPLAHCALAVMGEGLVRDASGKLTWAAAALAKAGISPVTLREKEGLALIYGTDGMLGMLVLAITDLRHLFSKAATVAALMKVEGDPALVSPRAVLAQS